MKESNELMAKTGLGRDVETQIEDRGAVRDPAGGDQIDAGGGDLGRGLDGDAAGGFGHGAAVDHFDRAAHCLRRHIVEQHRIDPDLQRLGERSVTCGTR